MIIVFLFMAGFYFMDSPSQRIAEHGIEEAIQKSEKNSILSCVALVQREAVRLDSEIEIDFRAEIDNDTACAAKYDISTIKICIADDGISSVCTPDRPGKTIDNFIITFAPAMEGENDESFLELLAAEFPDVKNFGILAGADNNFYLITGRGEKREIPAALATDAKLEPGQLVYVTQFAVAGHAGFAAMQYTTTVRCLPGELKVFRFNQWSCVQRNIAPICSGDKIWDDWTGACVPDVARRPLCGPRQTPIMTDEFWACMDPLPTTVCPAGQAAYLDYDTFDWVCKANPAATANASKCDAMHGAPKAGAKGGTMRVPVANCSDCEEMIVDPDTCETTCVPSSAKLQNVACYPRRAECSGMHRAFYFGFPDIKYIESAARHIAGLSDVNVPLDTGHSQNRKFNCLDCGEGLIDNGKSRPPYVAVCQQ